MTPSLRDLDGRDPYEILGVPPDASGQQIVEAHRRIVRQVHPDRPSGDADATRLVNLARAVLTNPLTRAEYDRQVAAGTEPEEAVDAPVASAWDAEDVQAGPAERATSAWDSVDPDPAPAPRPEPPFRTPPPFTPPPFGTPPPGPPSFGAPSFGMPPTGPLSFGMPPTGPPSFGTPPPGPPQPPLGHYWQQPQATRSSGWSLGVVALLCSVFCCTPVGLILGLVALSHKPARGSTDRVCALAAVWVSGSLILCGFGYLLLAALAGLGSSTGV